MPYASAQLSRAGAGAHLCGGAFWVGASPASGLPTVMDCLKRFFKKSPVAPTPKPLLRGTSGG